MDSITTIDPWLLLLIACVTIMAALISAKVRIVIGLVVFALMLVAAKNTFIRSATCPGLGEPCRKTLSPTWSAVCWSSADAAIGKEGGLYVLLSDGRREAYGRCADLRFWIDRDHGGDS